MQGGGVRGPTFAPAGGAVSVDVGPNDSSVEVSVAGSGNSTSHDVEPNKEASVTIPNVPPGTIIYITVGKGLRLRIIQVEVIALSP